MEETLVSGNEFSILTLFENAAINDRLQIQKCAKEGQNWNSQFCQVIFVKEKLMQAYAMYATIGLFFACF